MAQGSSNPTTDLKKIAGTNVDVNTGNASAGTQRIVLASNQPAIPISDNGGSLTVDGTVAVSSIIPGVAATNLGKATNAAAGSTDTGVAILGVREDALVTLPSADGDYTRLKLNSVGRVWVSAAIDTALPTGANVIGAVTQSGTWTVRSNELLGTATAITALNGAVAHALTGNVGAAVTVTAIATPVGFVITPQVSYDGGTNWVTSTFYNPVTELAEATIVNASLAVGLVRIILAADGATNVRVIATGWTSGSATFRISSSNAQGVVNLRSTAIHDSASGVSMQLVGGFASTTAPTAVAAGDAARIWTTLNGAVNIADGGTTISIDDGAGSITVDGTVSVNSLPAGSNNIGDVDVLSVIPGVAATNLGKATNAAAGATDTGVAILGVREDALVTLPSADGDYTRLKLNSVGRVWVSAAIDTALPAGANVIGAVTQSGSPWITEAYSPVSTATVLNALNAGVVIDLSGNSAAGVAITAVSTPSGITINADVSFDNGTNWSQGSGYFTTALGTKTGTITVNGTNPGYGILVGVGATHVRVRINTYTSGSITVLLTASNSVKATELFTSTPGNPTIAPHIVQLGGWDGSAARAVLTNSSGALSINDGGNSITVDGTVSVNALPAGANVIGAVTQSGTWNVGTVTTITTANLAADDVHDGAAGTTGVMLAGFASAATPTAVSADGDAARIWVNRSGAQITDGYSKLGTATALAALNASAVFALGGSKSSGITITAISAPSGMVLTPQLSFDGGTNYVATTFDNPATGDKTTTMTNAELVAGAMRTVMLAGGATHVRIVATSWTSGSATVLLSGSEARDTSEFFAASNNTANRPPATAQVGGWDGSNLRALSVTAAGAVNVGTVTTVTGVTTVTTVTGVTTVSTLTNQAQMGGQAINMGTGVRAAGTQRVTIATDDVVQTAALPQATAALAPTNATTTAYAASLIVKASAGTLYNITGYNSRTSGQFIQLYNSATLPANGVAPVVMFFVGANSNFSFNLGVYGRHFTTGIVIGNSTTGPTKTIGAADCWFDAQFK